MRCFAGSLFAVFLSAFLMACAAPSAPPAAANTNTDTTTIAAISADEAGQRYAVDAAQSSVRIHVFRAGRAANLGHNHVLSLPGLVGVLLLPLPLADKAEGARFELSFRLADMALDAPALRASLGPAWASLMSAEAIAATRTNMLGEGNLQAERFPEVRLRSTRISGEWPKLVAEVEIELHGQRQRQWLALQADWSAERIKASGSMVHRQNTPMPVYVWRQPTLSTKCWTIGDHTAPAR